MLSVINSLYDSLGLSAPVIARGKLLPRSMMAHLSNLQSESWDELFPEEQRPALEAWCKALQALMLLRVPCCYTSTPSTAVRRGELHTFSDASNYAIKGVSHLTPSNMMEAPSVFRLGKVKLAPSHGIPHLELCVAILGIEIAELINQELGIKH